MNNSKNNHTYNKKKIYLKKNKNMRKNKYNNILTTMIAIVMPMKTYNKKKKMFN